MRRGRTAFVFLVIAGLLIGGISNAQDRRRYAGPSYFQAFQFYETKGPLTRIVLRNGLTILIEEHSLYPLATVQTYVGNQGLSARSLAAAYLLARDVESSLSGSETLHAIGGTPYVESNADWNLYGITVPSRQVVKAIELQAATLAPMKRDGGVLQRLLDESIAEARRAEGKGTGSDWISRLGSRVDAGPLSDLKSSGGLAQAVTTVHRTTHRAERTILVISGSVFREGFLKRVVELYAKLPGSGSPARPGKAPSRAVTSQAALSYKHDRQDILHPRITLKIPTVGWRHPDHAALELAGYAMFRGRAGLLSEHGLAPKAGLLDFEAEMTSTGARGELLLRLYPDARQTDNAEVRAMTQLEVLRYRELRPEELDRAKALWLTNHYRNLQTLEKRAKMLARHEIAGDYRARESLPKLIAKISPAQVRRVARKALDPARWSVRETFPRDAEERSFTSRTFRETMEVLIEAARKKQIAEMDARPLSKKERTVTFPFEPRFHRSDLRYTSILRGPQIYLQEQHDVPLVHLGWFFPGGRSQENQFSTGITQLLLQTLLRTENAVGWAEFESWGAEIHPINEADFFGFLVTVLAPNKEKCLRFMIDGIGRAPLTEEVLALERKRLLSLQRRAGEDPRGELDWATRQLFAGDPYGSSVFGTAEAISAIDLEGLNLWKTSHMEKIHPWILVRGNMDGTSFLQPFIRMLSNSRYRSVPFGGRHGRAEDDEYADDDADDEAPAGGDIVSSAREGVITVGLGGPTKGSNDEWILDIAENLLAGAKGRLETLLQIAEDRPGMQVRMTHVAGLRKGAIFLTAASDASRQEDDLSKLLSRLDKLREAEIRPDLWRQAKVRTITQFHRSQQDGERYSLDLAQNILAGHGTGFEQSYLTAVKRAQRADFRFLAEKYFSVGDDEDDPDS